jgi:RHS repeat-associated protein
VIRAIRGCPKGVSVAAAPACEKCGIGLVAVVAVGWLAAADASAAETTVYVNDHFEVRNHDQPVKYVFNGDTRVARIIGSLTSVPRTQRIRLAAGWNLCSTAVNLSDGLRQLTNAQPPVVNSQSIVQWNAATQSWLPVAPQQPLAAGTMLWIYARANASLALAGDYADPADRVAAAGGTFIPSAGLEAAILPVPGAETALWQHDDARQAWEVQAGGLPGISGGPSAMLSPGETVFVDSGVPIPLDAPDPALRIRYDHQDHLGSSSAVTDADGALVEEVAYFPFGVERHAYQPRGIAEDYRFAAKERDRESGLHYFEARYLAGPIARFASVDPKYARLDGLSPDDLANFLGSPRDLNPYQYGMNNPLRFNDPTGLDKKETVSTANDVIGLGAGAVEEYALWTSRKGLEGGAGVVGKVTAGVSVAMKAYDFASNPNSGTGGQLLNESAKTLMGFAVPPVGLIWSALDLTGYGPSAILEATEKSIQANRAATKSYNQATVAWKQAAATYNEGAARIGPKLREVDAKLQHLVRETNKLNERTRNSLKGETRSLKELNDAIAKQERTNRGLKAELRRQEARLRRAQE